MTGLTKVTAGVIAANAVVDSFGSQSITGDKIGLTAINANNIVTGAITGDKLGATSINANNIVDSSITSGKIVSVANTQITGNITSSQIVPNPVFNGNTTVTNIIVGAGSNTAPSISPTGDTNTGIFFPAADNIGFATGGTIRGRWTTDGLCFGSDTAAANALDDYEEGTWTPAATSSTGSITSFTSDGTYTKVGNLVFVRGRIVLTNVGTAGGSLLVAGLPFTTAAGIRPFIGVAREDSATGNTFLTFAEQNDTTFRITALTNVGAITWTNNYSYIWSVTYKAA